MFPDLGQTAVGHDQQNLRLQYVHGVPFFDDEPVDFSALHLVHRALLLHLQLYADEWIFRSSWILDVECLRYSNYYWHCKY